MTAEEYLNSKDIWNHPRLTTRNGTNSYDVAELMEEYAREAVNNALQEAEEKILNEIRESKQVAKKKADDARIYVEARNLKYEDYLLNSYIFGLGYVQAKTGDIGYIKDIILSLQIKEFKE